MLDGLMKPIACYENAGVREDLERNRISRRHNETIIYNELLLCEYPSTLPGNIWNRKKESFTVRKMNGFGGCDRI